MGKRKKEVKISDSIMTVTKNDFITARGFSKINLKTRKFLYIIIFQCKRINNEFYEYSISLKNFTDLMGISPSHVYQKVDNITGELMNGYLEVKRQGMGDSKNFSLFSTCEYTNNEIWFKLNPNTTDFLLQLKGNLSKVLLNDLVKMRSKYSMDIWNLFQKYMKNQKPGVTQTIEFDVSLEELRKVTGSEDKLKQLGSFKERILDKAIREIKDNCATVIKYTYIKNGRKVVGFHFTAQAIVHFDYTEEEVKRYEQHYLESKRKYELYKKSFHQP